MLRNDTRFRIKLSLGRWDIIDPATDETICHASTWDKAVIAAREIQRSVLTPQADVHVSTRTFRETIRYEHLAKVLAERLRRQAIV